jgi:tetratricopeptide (TPR) repeat protein
MGLKRAVPPKFEASFAWLLILGISGGFTTACGPDQAWIDEQMKAALHHYQNRRLDPAYAAAIQVVDQAPGDAAARMLVARVEYYRQNFEAAADHCQAVLDENPEHFGALLWLARIWSNESGKEREAMALILRALRVETRSPELWHLKGLLHERMDEIADSIAAYRVATGNNRVALSHLRLADLYGRAELAERREYHRRMARLMGGGTEEAAPGDAIKPDARPAGGE